MTGPPLYIAVVLEKRTASHVAIVAAVNARRVTKLNRRLVESELKRQRCSKDRAYMKLLLFVLFGHVCLIGLGVADLVEFISDDLNDILLSFVNLRSHTQVTV